MFRAKSQDLLTKAKTIFIQKHSEQMLFNDLVVEDYLCLSKENIEIIAPYAKKLFVNGFKPRHGVDFVKSTWLCFGYYADKLLLNCLTPMNYNGYPREWMNEIICWPREWFEGGLNPTLYKDCTPVELEQFQYYLERLLDYGCKLEAFTDRKIDCAWMKEVICWPREWFEGGLNPALYKDCTPEKLEQFQYNLKKLLDYGCKLEEFTDRKIDYLWMHSMGCWPSEWFRDGLVKIADYTDCSERWVSAIICFFSDKLYKDVYYKRPVDYTDCSAEWLEAAPEFLRAFFGSERVRPATYKNYSPEWMRAILKCKDVGLVDVSTLSGYKDCSAEWLESVAQAPKTLFAKGTTAIDYKDCSAEWIRFIGNYADRLLVDGLKAIHYAPLSVRFLEIIVQNIANPSDVKPALGAAMVVSAEALSLCVKEEELCACLQDQIVLLVSHARGVSLLGASESSGPSGVLYPEELEPCPDVVPIAGGVAEED